MYMILYQMAAHLTQFHQRPILRAVTAVVKPAWLLNRRLPGSSRLPSAVRILKLCREVANAP